MANQYTNTTYKRALEELVGSPATTRCLAELLGVSYKAAGAALLRAYREKAIYIRSWEQNDRGMWKPCWARTYGRRKVDAEKPPPVPQPVRVANYRKQHKAEIAARVKRRTKVVPKVPIWLQGLAHTLSYPTKGRKRKVDDGDSEAGKAVGSASEVPTPER